MGVAAAERLGRAPSTDPLQRLETLNGYLFDEQGFAGNRSRYDDPRDSLLNAVLDRRTGIPITLALVYIEVARRAGVQIDGVNFPGHFLLRMPHRVARADHVDTDLIVDPFHGGAVLSEADCRRLLHDHVGEHATFNRRLLMRATKLQIVMRMLVNLKRTYVRMRSFPQGRSVTELLVALDPSGHGRAPRPGAAGVPPQRLPRSAARPGGLPALHLGRRARAAGGRRGARPDLGARQGAPPPDGQPKLK